MLDDASNGGRSVLDELMSNQSGLRPGMSRANNEVRATSQAQGSDAKNRGKKRPGRVIAHLRFDEHYTLTETVLGYGLNGEVRLGINKLSDRKV